METHTLTVDRSRLAISRGEQGATISLSRRGTEGEEADSMTTMRLNMDALRWLEQVVSVTIEMTLPIGDDA